MEWADDVANRPRRANAGSRLQELLQRGLDEEDEKDLLNLDNSSSDTSFTLGSDEEAMDEVESDFDAEEVAGVLEGEAVETEATVRRAERQARQQVRQQRLKRTQAFSKSAAHDRAAQQRRRKQQKQQQQQQRKKRSRGDADGGGSGGASSASVSSGGEEEEEEVIDLRQRVRHRPAPTIPCAQRLAEARDRAVARRAAQAVLDEEGGGEEEVNASLSLLHGQRGGRGQRRGGKPRRTGGRLEEMKGEGGGAPVGVVPQVVSPRIALYEGVAQRIGYSSGVSIRERFHVQTVVSFSEGLPAAFQGTSCIAE